MVAEVFERPAEFLHSEKKSPCGHDHDRNRAAVFSRVLGKPLSTSKFRLKRLSSKPEEVTIMYRAGLRTSATTRVWRVETRFSCTNRL